MPGANRAVPQSALELPAEAVVQSNGSWRNTPSCSSLWSRRARPSLGSQPSQDRFGEPRRDRKADAGVPPAFGNDHGIDADRLASPIDQRAAAVPRVDVRIRLNEAAVRLQFDLAIERAHDADGSRLIESKGAADGHDRLAHLQRR